MKMVLAYFCWIRSWASGRAYDGKIAYSVRGPDAGYLGIAPATSVLSLVLISPHLRQ